MGMFSYTYYPLLVCSCGNMWGGYPEPALAFWHDTRKNLFNDPCRKCRKHHIFEGLKAPFTFQQPEPKPRPENLDRRVVVALVSTILSLAASQKA